MASDFTRELIAETIKHFGGAATRRQLIAQTKLNRSTILRACQAHPAQFVLEPQGGNRPTLYKLAARDG